MADQTPAATPVDDLAQQPAAQAVGLTDERVTDIWHATPWPADDIEGKAVSFARAIERELLSRSARSGKPVAVVRDNPDDIGTIIEGLVPLEVGTQLYAAPQPSAQQAEPVAWVHEDDPARVISAVQKGRALKDGGASASSVRPYSVPAYTQQAEQPAKDRAVDEHALASRWNRIANSTDQRAAFMAEVRALLAAPAAAEAPCRFCQAVEEHKVPAGLADVFRAGMRAEAAHSRQAQGGALSEELRNAMEEVEGALELCEPEDQAAFGIVKAAILARAASEPRAEGLDDSAIEALRLAESALSECYDVTAWPADGKSECDKALVAVRAALAAQKKGA